jgi:glycosyltransferase involved in cell wall biosynthesis
MKITVILCTFNRCTTLAKTLDSIAASVLPDSVEWEVLVVDNNSTDRTRDVVEEFSRKSSGRFRYLFEPRPGKSYGLNAGIQEARGDVLAFVDDDVTVEPSWLHNLTAPLGDGEWAGTGGRTLLGQPFNPPAWLALNGRYAMISVVAAVFDLGDTPCELEVPPYGANMAFRKKTFEKYGLFRTDLGPSPDKETPRPSEDTEFGWRVLVGKDRLHYEPSAVVYHPLIESRIRKDYLLRWWFDFGRSKVREWGGGPPVLSIPRPYFNILRLVSTLMIRMTWHWLLAVNPHRRFFYKCWVWRVAGMVNEYYRRIGTIEANKDNSIPGCRVA